MNWIRPECVHAVANSSHCATLLGPVQWWRRTCPDTAEPRDSDGLPSVLSHPSPPDPRSPLGQPSPGAVAADPSPGQSVRSGLAAVQVTGLAAPLRHPTKAAAVWQLIPQVSRVTGRPSADVWLGPQLCQPAQVAAIITSARWGRRQRPRIGSCSLPAAELMTPLSGSDEPPPTQTAPPQSRGTVMDAAIDDRCNRCERRRARAGRARSAHRQLPADGWSSAPDVNGGPRPANGHISGPRRSALHAPAANFVHVVSGINFAMEGASINGQNSVGGIEEGDRHTRESCRASPESC